MLERTKVLCVGLCDKIIKKFIYNKKLFSFNFFVHVYAFVLQARDLQHLQYC